jgi:alkanesulfonate monooxygenase SsuD/methylene tetrahydromethanopterin reductase-like flavin-dependent oxidoreductase (luciferase family)
VRVCLMIEGQEAVTWEQWKALATTCERSGIETLFRSDHYLSVQGQGERGSLDAWTTIAALAAVTSTLRLGTLVSPVTFRHPSLLAKAVVTADHVSGGGRIELGLGGGWLEAEHAAYGFAFPPPAVRMEMLSEQLELVRKEWAEGTFTQEGRHYSVQNLDALPKPISEPRLLLGGGGGRRSLALAVRYADEYNVFHMSEEHLREVRSGLDDACKRVGRDPATLPLSLMDPVDKAPTEQVVQRFRQLESAGVERIMLQHLQHEDLDTVEWIGRELAPALA